MTKTARGKKFLEPSKEKKVPREIFVSKRQRSARGCHNLVNKGIRRL